MKKTNKHIVIVRGTKGGLSSMGPKSCKVIHDILAKQYESVEIVFVNELRDLKQLVDIKPDLVFLGMKFLPINYELGRCDPNKIWLSAYLDERGINYTGSSQEAMELELNKPLAKQHVLDAGFDTSRFFIAKPGEQPLNHSLPLSFPLFVKPTNMGGGQGVDANSVVNNFDDLQAKVSAISVKYNSNSLVEEYLSGREFSVAVLENKQLGELSVMPIELVAEQNEQGNRMLGQEVKNSNSEVVSRVSEGSIRRKVVKLATNIFFSLGARDYGRIDIRLDRNGTPQFLEANLIPSLMCGYGSFPKSCLINLNLDQEAMILRIVRSSLTRNEESLPEIVEPDSNNGLTKLLLKSA